MEDAYFTGANGILAVADYTQRSTLDELATWVRSVERVAGQVPLVIAVNKMDRASEAAFEPSEIDDLAARLRCRHFMTSAKTGENVEAVFRELGDLVVRQQLGLQPVLPA